MAQGTERAQKRGSAAREMLRLAGWGLTAAAAVTVAVMIGLTDTGLARLFNAWSGSQQQAQLQPLDAAAAPAIDESVIAGLTDELRALGADRDSLAARVTALERSLEDVTGSVTLSLERAAAAERLATRERPTAAPPVASAPATQPVAIQTPRVAPNPVPPTFVLLEPALGINRAPFSDAHSGEIWSRVPIPRPPAVAPAAPAPQALAPVPAADPATTASVPPRTEFGVDLGGGASTEALKALWTTTRAQNAALFERLRPVVGARPTSRELRLVVGPLPSAAAAARICATLLAAGAACQPAVFDGQRPALR